MKSTLHNGKGVVTVKERKAISCQQMQKLTFSRKISLIFFLGGILVFYLWTTSTSYHKPFEFNFGKNLGVLNGGYHGEGQVDYYNALSDAFLSGQLHLLINPGKELLAVADPYNPTEDRPYFLHDASLYKGKYYLYFGPVPALVFFTPFRLIFQVNLPQDFAIALLGFGGLIWFTLILNFLTKTYLPKTPYRLFFIAIVCSSFCNVIPFISRRPTFYEVAISSGYFCLTAALYWLISGVFSKKIVLWRLLLGSLFLGLAVGSRYYFIFALFFLILVWWKILKEQHNYQIIKSFKEATVLFVPFSACVVLLLLYNYARFGALLEFGNSYQLTVVDMRTFKFYDPAFIIPNLYFYFIQPCIMNSNFPFFHLDPIFHFTSPKGYLFGGIVYGILIYMPFLNILFIFPMFYKKISQSNKDLILLMTSFILLGLIFVLFISFIAGATMRYIVDFVSLLLLSAFLFWFFLNNLFQNNKPVRLMINSIMIIAIVYGCLFNICISFIGYKDLLNKTNPELYKSLAQFFGS